MHISTKSRINRKIKETIEHYMAMFESFEKVYLFGSILDENRIPNDIDLLLIYIGNPDKITVDLTVINEMLMGKFDLPVHFTIMSNEELNDTTFLEKLKLKYVRLK